uniref:Uncharacterized protein n=1 Tax=Amphilophus citrinellus TaxID=61819 RepID=A0A3Q0RP15_AMPCI
VVYKHVLPISLHSALPLSLCFVFLNFYFRRSSYGRLVDSQDYSMAGNFNNPMYDPDDD